MEKPNEKTLKIFKRLHAIFGLVSLIAMFISYYEPCALTTNMLIGSGLLYLTAKIELYFLLTNYKKKDGHN